MRSVATAAVLCAAAAAGTAPSYGVCWTRNKLNASGAKLTRACVPRTVNGTGQPLHIVCQTPSPPLKLLVRRFLAHRMRATARHWWLPWPLACRVAGFLV